jgi:hypothetical protein
MRNGSRRDGWRRTAFVHVILHSIYHQMTPYTKRTFADDITCRIRHQRERGERTTSTLPGAEASYSRVSKVMYPLTSAPVSTYCGYALTICKSARDGSQTQDSTQSPKNNRNKVFRYGSTRTGGNVALRVQSTAFVS